MKNFLSYFKHYKRYVIIAPLFKFLEACFELMVPLIVSRIIDEGIKCENKQLIITYFLILIGFAIIGIICALIAQYYSSKCAILVTKNIRKDLFYHYQSLSIEEQSTISSSKILNLMNSDMNQIQNAINLFLRLFLRAPIIVFGSLVMAFIINKQISIIFFCLIPILIVLVYLIMTKSIPLFGKAASIKDEINKKTSDNLTGVRVIRAFNNEENEINEFMDVNKELYQNEIKANNVSILLSPFTSFMINLGIIAIFYFLSIQNNKQLYDDSGELVALYNYMSNILVEIIKLTNLFITITKGIASYKRIQTVLEIKQNNKVIFDQSSANSNSILTFDHVRYSYPNASKDALVDLTFNVLENETIGIIGGTGSGKSTLLQLITGIIQQTSGKIYLYNKEISTYSKEELENKISIVLQKSELFQGSIQENILFGRELLTESLNKAIENSDSSSIISRKENGVHSLLTKNASNCSGGEKQRLSIARALYKQSEILLLDDSFSSLDYLTDKTIRDNIQANYHYKAIFITSQRISSLLNCNKIIVLNNGSIEQIGTHEELLKSSQTYRNIYDLQFNQGKEK